ncbi:MAG: acetolactate decarboxylase, partial [Deltaproteobacteria bacterium]|nr:acetolactate decarboxylase [Deltaproteobacteria bacterium]
MDRAVRIDLFEDKSTRALREATLKTIRCSLAAIFLSIAICGCSGLQKNKDVLFQTSTIDALLAGVYDGHMTIKELKKHGDFGLGTFDGLDGEMVGLDGEFYQIKVDGTACPVDDSMKTPFAVVTFFEPDESLLLDEEMNCEELSQYLDGKLPTENIFYAVKIEGGFEYIKTRSVPRQNKPYPPLVEVVKDQSILEFYDVRGTIVGFRTPHYMKGINVPGYHLHFIAADRRAGGHLLECRMQDVGIELDYTSEFYVVLP